MNLYAMSWDATNNNVPENWLDRDVIIELEDGNHILIPYDKAQLVKIMREHPLYTVKMRPTSWDAYEIVEDWKTLL